MANRFVRMQWWPPLALGFLAMIIFHAVTDGLTTLRIVGIVVCALWSGLALYNQYSGGKFLQWLYPDATNHTTN